MQSLYRLTDEELRFYSAKKREQAEALVEQAEVMEAELQERLRKRR
jgi:hypothetical protein